MRSLEIEFARLFAELRIFLRLLEEFVELAVEHVALILFGREGFLEGLFAASRFALELGYGGGEVFDGGALTGSSWEITARSWASIFSADWQQGQVTSNNSFFMARS